MIKKTKEETILRAEKNLEGAKDVVVMAKEAFVSADALANPPYTKAAEEAAVVVTEAETALTAAKETASAAKDKKAAADVVTEAETVLTAAKEALATADTLAKAEKVTPKTKADAKKAADAVDDAETAQANAETALEETKAIKVDIKAPYTVAEGHSFVSAGRILGPGKAIESADFDSKKSFDKFVELGNIVKNG